MVAFTYRMPAGIPGDLTRQSVSTVEAQAFDATLPFASYGIPGKISVNNKFAPINTGDTAAAVYGFLVRPFPAQGPNASDPLGTSVPPTSGICNVLRRGYVNVVVNAGAPVVGGPVYVRVAVPAGAKVIGGLEAVADGANTIVLTNAFFTGGADPSGNAEIGYNI